MNAITSLSATMSLFFKQSYGVNISFQIYYLRLPVQLVAVNTVKIRPAHLVASTFLHSCSAERAEADFPPPSYTRVYGVQICVCSFLATNSNRRSPINLSVMQLCFCHIIILV